MSTSSHRLLLAIVLSLIATLILLMAHAYHVQESCLSTTQSHKILHTYNIINNIVYMDLTIEQPTRSPHSSLIEVLEKAGMRIVEVSPCENATFPRAALGWNKIDKIIVHIDGSSLRNREILEKASRLLSKPLERGALVIFYSESPLNVRELSGALKLLIEDKQVLSKINKDIQKKYSIYEHESSTTLNSNDKIKIAGPEKATQDVELYVFGIKVRRLPNGYTGLSTCSFTTLNDTVVAPASIYNFIITCLEEVK